MDEKDKNELNTYDKVSIIIGEIIFASFPVYGIIWTLIEFYRGKRGFISTYIITLMCIWILCEFYDAAASKYKWLQRKKNKDSAQANLTGKFLVSVEPYKETE